MCDLCVCVLTGVIKPRQHHRDSERFSGDITTCSEPHKSAHVYTQSGACITLVCALPAFYFTVGQPGPSPYTYTTIPRLGGCHGPPLFGSFSASRRSFWAIPRQCTGLCLFVDISYQSYHKSYSDLLLLLLRFGLTIGPVWRLLSAIEMLHTHPQSPNLP